MKSLFVFIISFFIFYSVQGQTIGCTDKRASNYEQNATLNNGSCNYDSTNYNLIYKFNLPAQLNEISGMTYWNGKIYGHQDSGGPNKIFEFDTITGTITKKIILSGATNVDWEDLTQDSLYFYVADIGNNTSGNRTDLKIYKFPKSSIGPDTLVTIGPTDIEIINYSYPDQTDLTPKGSNNTPFDCEAIVFIRGKLHLFTKNWVGTKTVHYSLPKDAGTYVATKLDSLDTRGVLITGASTSGNNEIMLVGYKKTGLASCALWYLFDFDSSDYFIKTGNKRKIDLGSAINLGQIEAVCFSSSTNGFISNENFHLSSTINVPQRLCSFDISQWKKNVNPTIDIIDKNNQSEENIITIISNPTNNPISINVNAAIFDLAQIKLIDILGNTIIDEKINISAGVNKIQLEYPFNNITGMFIVTISIKDKIYSKKILLE